MNHLLRPYLYLGVAAALALVAVPGLGAQATHLKHLLEEANPLISHSNSSGYLGVLVGDLDGESASRLKLREARGAVITLIDHDAPAGQIGLKVNDVVLALNGQAVDNAEHFSHMLREYPAGRKVTLTISREGSQQNIVVQLVDRKAMEHDVWNKMNSADTLPQTGGMGLLPGAGDAPLPGFRMPSFGSNSLNVGAMVEPLTSQMAEYLGLPNGVMVKQVARKSEAYAAGLKAFDVILRVGAESVSTTADWDRALRANQGKQVQVLVLRDRRQQVLNLQVDSKRHSRAEFPEPFERGQWPEMAELDGLFGPEFAAGVSQAAEEMSREAELLGRQLLAHGFPEVTTGPQQSAPQQTDELDRQMEQLRQSFEDFQIDPRQMDELRRRMQEFQKNFERQFAQQPSPPAGRPA